MLKLSDFFHLPQVEALVRQVITDTGPGLVVVAGLDPRPLAGDVTGFLPGGRAAIFRILLREMLLESPRLRCIVVAEERAAVSIPRRLANRVDLALVQPPAAIGVGSRATAGAGLRFGHPGILFVLAALPAQR